MPSRPDIIIRNGQVYSSRFDDIYFSRDNGPAESQYVFLKGNDLPDRWRQHRCHVIAETGFGTGLNFLVTLRCWLRDPSACNSLQYYSIERFPLSLDQLSAVYKDWPELEDLARQLIAQYPPVDTGVHTLMFADGRVQLHLLLMDLKRALAQFSFNPDSWYLDGFAPAKNPSMWDDLSLAKIAALSSPGTRLATFTAAGDVRRALESAGFDIQKRKGFGHKREMITATRNIAETEPAQHQETPWFSSPDVQGKLEHVAVIGAGIAGAQVAWHLALRGIEVTVIEADDKIAGGASGNPAGILAPRLTATHSTGEEFYLSAFLYQLRQLRLLSEQGKTVAFSRDGLLQLAKNSTEVNRFDKLKRRKDLPPDIMQAITGQLAEPHGAAIDQVGVYIESACALIPRSLVQALLDSSGISTRLSSRLETVKQARDGLELTLCDKSCLQVDAVVLANGYQASEFDRALKITPVRGQTSIARLNDEDHPWPAIDHAAYLVHVPGDSQQVVFGATYQRDDTGTDLRGADTKTCQDKLAQCIPGVINLLADIRPAHAGIRATTFDRWPLLGAVPRGEFYRREYADLHQGRQYKYYPPAEYRRGVYVLSGLGSRGLATAGYCANLLTHTMLGTAPPADERVLHQTHPARFLVRELKRGNRK